MTQEQLKKAIGKNVIVSEQWGFGLKFYQAKLQGIGFHYFHTHESTHLHLEFYEKYRPITSRTFSLQPNNQMVYLPS